MEVERFLSHIGRETVDDKLEDKLRWMKTRDGVFSLKSMYQALKPRTIESFLLPLVWKSCVQPKIYFST